jgi:hypothetical protein
MANITTFTGSEGLAIRCSRAEVKSFKVAADSSTHEEGDVITITNGVIGLVMEKASATQDFMVAYDVPMVILAKKTTENFIAGQIIYYDDDNDQLTSTATNLKPIAICLEKTASGAATCLVHWVGTGMLTTTLDIVSGS